MHWNFQHLRQSLLPTTAGTPMSTRRGDNGWNGAKETEKSPWRSGLLSTLEDTGGWCWVSMNFYWKTQSSPGFSFSTQSSDSFNEKIFSSKARGGMSFFFFFFLASQVVLGIKKCLPRQETRDSGLTPRSGGSPGGGHGNPLQYSCLGNSMDRGAWWATKSQTGL